MTVSCRFFSNGDTYNQPDFAKLMLDAVGTGVCPNVTEDNMKVIATSPSTMSVNISLGRAYIRGYSVDIEDEVYNVTIPAADTSNTRIDTIIAKLSVTTNKNITFTVKSGEPSATPQPATLTQDSETWEMRLAYVTVGKGVVSITDSDIEDKREYCNNPDTIKNAVCGVLLNNVSQTVENNIAKIVVPTATSSTLGLVKGGSNVSISSGAITVSNASKSNKGVVQIGDNINVSSGVISIPKAAVGTLGVISEGNYCTVSSSGALSIDIADGTTKGVVCEGYGIGVSDGDVWNKMCESKTWYVTNGTSLTNALTEAKEYATAYIYLTEGTYDISTIKIYEWMNVVLIFNNGNITFSNPLTINCDGHLTMRSTSGYNYLFCKSITVTSNNYCHPTVVIDEYVCPSGTTLNGAGLDVLNHVDVTVRRLEFDNSADYGVYCHYGGRAYINNIQGKSNVTYPACLYDNCYCQIGICSGITFDPMVYEGSICFVNGKLKSS